MSVKVQLIIDVARNVPPLSASETRHHLKFLVPDATEAELDQAIYELGFVSDGRD